MLLENLEALLFYSFPGQRSFYFLTEAGHRDGKIIVSLSAPHPLQKSILNLFILLKDLFKPYCYVP